MSEPAGTGLTRLRPGQRGVWYACGRLGSHLTTAPTTSSPISKVASPRPARRNAAAAGRLVDLARPAALRSRLRTSGVRGRTASARYAHPRSSWRSNDPGDLHAARRVAQSACGCRAGGVDQNARLLIGLSHVVLSVDRLAPLFLSSG